MHWLREGGGGGGVAVGLTDKPSTLKQWVVAGPELSAMVQEFEVDSSSNRSTKPWQFNLHLPARFPNW